MAAGPGRDRDRDRNGDRDRRAPPALPPRPQRGHRKGRRARAPHGPDPRPPGSPRPTAPALQPPPVPPGGTSSPSLTKPARNGPSAAPEQTPRGPEVQPGLREPPADTREDFFFSYLCLGPQRNSSSSSSSSSSQGHRTVAAEEAAASSPPRGERAIGSTGRTPIPNGGRASARAGSSSGNGTLAPHLRWRQLGRQPGIGTGTDAWATAAAPRARTARMEAGPTPASPAGTRTAPRHRRDPRARGTGDAAESTRSPETCTGMFLLSQHRSHTTGSAPPASQRAARWGYGTARCTAWPGGDTAQPGVRHSPAGASPHCQGDVETHDPPRTCPLPNTPYFTNSLPQSPEEFPLAVRIPCGCRPHTRHRLRFVPTRLPPGP
ncbi:uncharacterized protein J5F26_015148 [Ciconia maguari]